MQRHDECIGFRGGRDLYRERDRKVTGDNGLRQLDEFDLEVREYCGNRRDNAASICDQDSKQVSGNGNDFSH